LSEDAMREASDTVRQRLMRWLARSEYSFEDLRTALEIPARELEEELRHVEKSARGQGLRLRVREPACRDCGFAFPGRTRKHFHPPSRCPKCKSQRIEPPSFRVA
jgi:predicted Zn-ribbon and HTH transcriptional regulator